METWSAHQLERESEKLLSPQTALNLKLYAQTLKEQDLPVIFTLRHLAKIVDVDYTFLRHTVERRREAANYRVFAIRKRSGGRRVIHSLSNDLHSTQQFLNTQILQHVPVHKNAYAFHKKGGIRNCAAAHCGARWIFQFDIDNFFFRINEAQVYAVFNSLGYRPLLALELARICTTTYPSAHLAPFLKNMSNEFREYKFYDYPNRVLGVLSQGGPASPMLSNLVAKKLDERLSSFARPRGFIVTRYADDLTLSTGNSLPANISVSNIIYSVIKIIRESGFKENTKKIRVAGPGSKKLVLGLLVDGDVPRISKETYKRIDRHLYASLKYGILNVAAYEKFDSPLGFYNHLQGLINFVKDVDPTRATEFSERFCRISHPYEHNSIHN